MIKHQEEGSHWYKKDGSPCYEVEMTTKQGTRQVTVSDAKKLGLLPSVTNVMGIINKPALNTWIKNEYVKATVSLLLKEVQKVYVERNYSILSPESFSELVRHEIAETPEFISSLIEAGNAERDRTASEGTRIHDIIESWVKNREVKDVKVIESFVNGLESFGIYENSLISEESFASELGFAGKIDLFSPVNGIVLDVKTKDFDESNIEIVNGITRFNKKKKFIYDDNAIQLAAYSRMLNESKYATGFNKVFTRGINIYISRLKPSLIVFHEWSDEELKKGWEKFYLMFQLFKLEKGL